MSLFIEGLLLFDIFTLDPAIRVNKLFLDVDVTKLSGTWKHWKAAEYAAEIEIKRVN